MTAEVLVNPSLGHERVAVSAARSRDFPPTPHALLKQQGSWHTGMMNCPKCESPAIPLLLGLPGPSATEAAKDNQIALGGCFVAGDGTDPNWVCTKNSKHTWLTGSEDSDWDSAVRAALAGRPHCPVCGAESRIIVAQEVAQWYQKDIESGNAFVAIEALPPGSNTQNQCVDCEHVWQPSRSDIK